MSFQRKDKPRTGDGRKAKGKKPSQVGHLEMRDSKGLFYSTRSKSQPKGWGIAKVIDLFRKD